MTAKDKAKELVDYFYNLQEKIEWGNDDLKKEAGDIYEKNNIYYEEFYKELSKQSALKVVNEILEAQFVSIKLHEIEYWKNVKREIKKL
jgi:NAD+--asparagine ADP-ribosyltransferase